MLRVTPLPAAGTSDAFASITILCAQARHAPDTCRFSSTYTPQVTWGIGTGSTYQQRVPHFLHLVHWRHALHAAHNSRHRLNILPPAPRKSKTAKRSNRKALPSPSSGSKTSDKKTIRVRNNSRLCNFTRGHRDALQGDADGAVKDVAVALLTRRDTCQRQHQRRPGYIPPPRLCRHAPECNETTIVDTCSCPQLPM